MLLNVDLDLRISLIWGYFVSSPTQVETCVQQCMEFVSSGDRSKDLVSHVTEKLDMQTLGKYVMVTVHTEHVLKVKQNY